MSTWAIPFLNVNVQILHLIQKEQSEIWAAVDFVSTSWRETILLPLFCLFAFPWLYFVLLGFFPPHFLRQTQTLSARNGLIPGIFLFPSDDLAVMFIELMIQENRREDRIETKWTELTQESLLPFHEAAVNDAFDNVPCWRDRYMISFLYPDGSVFKLIVCALRGGYNSMFSNRATTKHLVSQTRLISIAQQLNPARSAVLR